jgi:sulfur relay (sulfurtransferase) DsrF/TusC family protein
MKNVVVLVTTAPGPRASEALRAALGMTAADHAVSVAFVGDGVLACLKAAPPEYLARLRESAKLYAEMESLGVGPPCDGVLPVMRPALAGLLAGADAILGF